MPLSRSSLRLLLAVALVALAVVGVSYVWRLRGEAGLSAAGTAALEQQRAELVTQLQRTAQRALSLEQAVRAATNRLAQAVARYEEEKKTHDPLRRQVEKMLEAETTYKTQLAQRDADLHQQQSGTAALATEVQGLKVANAELTRRSDGLQSDLRAKTDAEAEQRKQAAEAAQRMDQAQQAQHQAEQKWQDAQARIKELTQAAAAQSQAMQDLKARVDQANQQLEQVKKPSAAPPPAGR